MGASPPARTRTAWWPGARANGTTAKSPASSEVVLTVAAGSRVTVEWDAVPDATEYLVYGRTPAAQGAYWKVTSTSFTDDGTSAGAAGTPSASGTVWQVKNLLELKHTRRALIAYNLMENNWAQAQQGFAILLSPRNQGGSCLWCQVADITMEYNVVRHTGAGIKISGWDDIYPSQQTKNVIVRHNVFADVSKAWGGTGYAFILLSGPKTVTIDHNTVISPDGAGVLTVDQSPVEEFTFTNNVARHNVYGIQGSGKGVGNTVIAYYFPGGTVTNNVFAGGKASSYPAGNRFPSLAEFANHFTAYAAGDFTLKPGTDWEHAGTDGLDLGAAAAAIEGAEKMTPPRITTLSLPSTTETFAYSHALERTGGRAPYQWTVLSGTLPTGLALDVHTGAISGTATLSGTYAFTVQVEDATGATGSQPFSVQVARFVSPVAIVTTGVVAAMETVPYAQMFAASGGAGTYTWSVTAGALPAGLSLTPQGLLAGTPVASSGPRVATSHTFTVTAVDAADTSRWASRSFTLIVAPRPNAAPQVSMTAPADQAVVFVGATVTLTAAPVDTDGSVQRVDFYLGDERLGGVVAPSFRLPWVVPTSGTYTFTAVVVDDQGATSVSEPVTITTKSEIVLHAPQVRQMAGNFKLNPDVAAASGYSLWLVNKSLAKVNTAVAAPAHYAEFTFDAEAGRPYRLWMRGRAETNAYSNDSVHVQFDGVPAALIGTTTSMVVNLEDAGGAGVSGWGWQDNGYGAGVLGPLVVFTRTGLQTMRIQNREDGLMIDQIVLSPAQYLTTAPGALKNDTTILPQ